MQSFFKLDHRPVCSDQFLFSRQELHTLSEAIVIAVAGMRSDVQPCIKRLKYYIGMIIIIDTAHGIWDKGKCLWC